MIAQQINLYQPLFRRQKKVFSFQAMVAVTLIVFAALLLISGYARWQLHLLQQQHARLQAQESETATRMAELSSRLGANRDRDRLVAEIERLETELAARRAVLARLAGREAINTEGFSAQLTGLSRQAIDGLWLTGIRLEEGGRRVSLAGNAVAPALLPRYVQRLGEERAFEGVLFRSLRIYRHEDTERYVGFSLTSEAEQEKEGARR